MKFFEIKKTTNFFKQKNESSFMKLPTFEMKSRTAGQQTASGTLNGFESSLTPRCGCFNEDQLTLLMSANKFPLWGLKKEKPPFIQKVALFV